MLCGNLRMGVSANGVSGVKEGEVRRLARCRCLDLGPCGPVCTWEKVHC